MEGLAGSSPLPATLNDGETASWLYPEKAKNGKNWYRGFAEHFKEYNRIFQWLLVRNLRFFVVTSLGNEFVAPPSTELREKVRQQLLEVNQET